MPLADQSTSDKSPLPISGGRSWSTSSSPSAVFWAGFVPAENLLFAKRPHFLIVPSDIRPCSRPRRWPVLKDQGRLPLSPPISRTAWQCGPVLDNLLPDRREYSTRSLHDPDESLRSHPRLTAKSELLLRCCAMPSSFADSYP